MQNMPYLKDLSNIASVKFSVFHINQVNIVYINNWSTKRERVYLCRLRNLGMYETMICDIINSVIL